MLTAVPLLLLLLAGAAATAASGSLYKESSGVLQLDGGSFDAAVLGRYRATFVEFYSQWCGHCIDFAPKYAAFADDVRHWSAVVQVAAVNCADKENTELCRRQAVEYYPTLRYYPHLYRPDADTSELLPSDQRKGDRDGRWLPLQLADFVRADAERRKGETGDGRWPRFDNVSDTADLGDLRRDGAALLLVVIQRHPRLGYALALDYWKSTRVQVALVSDSNERIDAGALGREPDTYAALFDTGSMRTIATAAIDDLPRVRIDMRAAVEAQLGAAGGGKKARPTPSATGGTTAVDVQRSAVNKYEVHWVDIRSGLAYMLKQEVALKREIAGPQLETLRKFVHLLAAHVPATRGARDLLRQLDAWLAAVDTHEGTSGAEVARTLHSLQESLDYPLGGNITWRACAGSQPHYRGYPCSLWTIFHLVTVNAYKASERGGGASTSALEVLRPIADFVAHFFTCRECVRNFGKGAAKMADNVHGREDVVLWLWRSHNRANYFLRKDRASSDPLFVKEQFPTVAQCALCRVDNSLSEEAPLAAVEANWRDEHVLAFLLRYYERVRWDGADDAIHAAGLNPKFAALLNRRQFDAPAADWRLSLGLWLACGAAVLLLACGYRQRRDKCCKRLLLRHDCKTL